MELFPMDPYRNVDICRCCKNKVVFLLDLNKQPLANSYHDKKQNLESYPLELNICDKCFHTQLSVTVHPDLMFKKYLYVSGTTETLKQYFDFFAKFTIQRFKHHTGGTPKNVLDIACNDGTQLDYFKKQGLSTFGIDPAKNLYDQSSKNHTVICDYFPSDQIKNKYDLIVAQNVFAHTDDVDNFLINIKQILSDNGILYIQTSQSNMILNNEFDTIYHEHLSFFNTLSMKTLLERFNLKLNNVFKFDIHGSSYIFEISNNVVDSNLDSVLQFEKDKGLYDINTYKNFANSAKEIVNELNDTIKQYRDQNYLIIGYGAAAKGMTVLNFGNIKMDYIIDDNPLKNNLYTPGTDIAITDISILNEFKDKNILFVPLAWNFYEEIVKRIKNVRTNTKDVYVLYFPKLKITKN